MEWSAITSSESHRAYSQWVAKGLHRHYGPDTSILLPRVAIRDCRCWAARRRVICFWQCWSKSADDNHFVVVGFVVMAEHVHLLIGEPEPGNASSVMQPLKQSFARRVLRIHRRGVDPRQGVLWNLALDQRKEFDKRPWPVADSQWCPDWQKSKIRPPAFKFTRLKQIVGRIRTCHERPRPGPPQSRCARLGLLRGHKIEQ